jgi:hypothetical protein
MKTLTTLTAVAALIAGISIASAQMSQSSSSPGANNASPESSQQATGNGKYCIETSPGGALNCKYASLSACQKDARAENKQCAPNLNSGTTGSSSNMK